VKDAADVVLLHQAAKGLVSSKKKREGETNLEDDVHEPSGVDVPRRLEEVFVLLLLPLVVERLSGGEAVVLINLAKLLSDRVVVAMEAERVSEM
jgi:hypothetical protein